METELVLLISVPNDAWSRFTLEGIAWELVGTSATAQSRGWAGWTPAGLKIRVEGAAINDIRRRLDNYIERVMAARGSLEVVEKEVGANPLPNVFAGDIPTGTVLRAKLTKKLFDLLPEGAGILSNCYDVDSNSTFAKWIGSARTRPALWRDAKNAGAHNRLFRLVWTELDLNGPILPSPPDRLHD